MSLIQNLKNQLRFFNPYLKWSERKNVTQNNRRIKDILKILNHLSGNDTLAMLNALMNHLETKNVLAGR